MSPEEEKMKEWIGSICPYCGEACAEFIENLTRPDGNDIIVVGYFKCHNLNCGEKSLIHEIRFKGESA